MMSASATEPVAFSSRQPITATMWIALAAAVATGVRYQFGPGLTPCLVVAAALLPVWWGTLKRYRFSSPSW